MSFPFLKMVRTVKFVFRLLPAAGAMVLLPTPSWACSACSNGDPKTAGVYLATTVVMSALPMLIVAGIGYWLYRRNS